MYVKDTRDTEVLERMMDSLFWWMNDVFDSLIMFDLFLISLGKQQAGTSLIELCWNPIELLKMIVTNPINQL